MEADALGVWAEYGGLGGLIIATLLAALVGSLWLLFKHIEKKDESHIRQIQAKDQAHTEFIDNLAKSNRELFEKQHDEHAQERAQWYAQRDNKDEKVIDAMRAIESKISANR